MYLHHILHLFTDYVIHNGFSSRVLCYVKPLVTFTILHLYTDYVIFFGFSSRVLCYIKPLALVHKKSGSFLHTIFQTSSFSCGCLILLTSSVKILCGSFLTKYSNALLKNGPLQKSIAFCCDDHAKASSNKKKQSHYIIASCKLIFKQCLPFVFADRWEMHFSTNVPWTNYFVKSFKLPHYFSHAYEEEQ